MAKYLLLQVSAGIGEIYKQYLVEMESAKRRSQLEDKQKEIARLEQQIRDLRK